MKIEDEHVALYSSAMNSVPSCISAAGQRPYNLFDDFATCVNEFIKLYNNTSDNIMGNIKQFFHR